MSRWTEELRSRLDELDHDDRRRRLAGLEPTGPVTARLDDRELVIFSSNDYLGLSSHPEVLAALEQGARSGMGPRGSALVCGYTAEHRRLEEELAAMCGTERALLVGSGFAANAGTLAALAATGVDVYSDELNHASIIDGCRLARANGATVQVYRHADAGHLESLLTQGRGRPLIVTDTVFSMDGDTAPLAELVELKDRFGALLMTDEAHATLLEGERGSGLAEALGVEAAIDVHVGTLSKAVGCQGGFVASSRDLVDWLVNRSRPYVFSTALPVPLAVAARAALRVARRNRGLLARLNEHVARLRSALGCAGRTPIVSLVLGAEERALAAATRLRDLGLWVPAIRPPTVREGTSRLRITLSAAHREQDVARLAEGVADVVRATG